MKKEEQDWRMMPYMYINIVLILCMINVHTKNTRNELARPIMGTIFLVSMIQRI